MLKLLDQFRDVDSTEGEGKTSRHSRRLLREVEIGFNCADAAADQLTDDLNAARKESAALEGDDGTRWVVGTHSHSNTNGGAWHFTVALREVEEVRAERLEFLGLTLTPSHYDERDATGDRTLMIVTEVAPSFEDSETLEHHIIEQRLRNEGETTHYFDLRRIGVQDEPLQVRFGRCLWQKGEGGARRHLLVFVAADDDDDETRRGFVGLDEPRSTNAARVALQGREIVEAIIDEVALAGILPQEAIERIRQRGESAWDKRFRDLSETSDLSLFH
ncbi:MULTISPECIES: hypothetical protein [Nocardioides]|uniref:hypothetical protein n=1 Tax=Nocardioides TaxID=1839 RepID=UPI0012EC9855|nr:MULTISPECIES: hypothetical protein [Nocardioides]